MGAISENPKSNLNNPLETGAFIKRKNLSPDELAEREAAERAQGASPQEIEDSKAQIEPGLIKNDVLKIPKSDIVGTSLGSKLAEVRSGTELADKKAVYNAADLAKFLSGDKNFDERTLGTDMEQFLEEAKKYSESNQS